MGQGYINATTSVCSDCQYIPTDVRNTISTCANTPVDKYTWVSEPYEAFSPPPPTCKKVPIVGSACSTSADGGCTNAERTLGYSCRKEGEQGLRFYGRIIDDSGVPVSGVSVVLYSG